MIICASVVLFALVVMRMVDLVRQQERSVARERMLSSCGAALVACATREEMQQRRAGGGRAAAGGPRRGGAVPDRALRTLRDGLTAVARSDDADWPARVLPRGRARGCCELAAEGATGEVTLEPALLAALDLPRDWTSGLVLRAADPP